MPLIEVPPAELMRGVLRGERLHTAYAHFLPPEEAAVVACVAEFATWGPSWDNHVTTPVEQRIRRARRGITVTEADMLRTFGPNWRDVVPTLRDLRECGYRKSLRGQPPIEEPLLRESRGRLFASSQYFWWTYDLCELAVLRLQFWEARPNRAIDTLRARVFRHLISPDDLRELDCLTN